VSTRIFVVDYTVNGRAVLKTFTEKSSALAYAREVVENPDASAVSVWAYGTSLAPREALARCMERAEWFDSRDWLGVIAKGGRFIKGKERQ
jgi:hypothetical protein